MTADHGSNLRPPTTWGANIRGISHMLVVPQGFTLSVAGVSLTLMGHTGYPGVLAVWLFVFGAGLAFSLMTLASRAHRDAFNQPLSIVGWALLNLVPTVVVPTTCALVWSISNKCLAFLTAGFVTVATYIVVVAGYVAAASRVRHRAREPSWP